MMKSESLDFNDVFSPLANFNQLYRLLTMIITTNGYINYDGMALGRVFQKSFNKLVLHVICLVRFRDRFRARLD